MNYQKLIFAKAIIKCMLNECNTNHRSFLIANPLMVSLPLFISILKQCFHILIRFHCKIHITSKILPSCLKELELIISYERHCMETNKYIGVSNIFVSYFELCFLLCVCLF